MQKFNVNGQLVSKLKWKQTDEQTNGGDCITSLAKAIGKMTGFDCSRLIVLIEIME